jgi:D-aminopeptidase
MPTARLCADTAAMPDGTLGYEGTLEGGFRPAVNNIHWTGDAGIGASLDDMIAWERFIDATRDDEAGLYRRLSAPQNFQDGTPAQYGFGLAQVNLLGRRGTGHGGGLRGWCSFRCYLPEQRVSIVVLFNHMSDPRAAAMDLATALFGAPDKPAPLATSSTGWNGVFQEPETGLVVRLETTAEQRVRLHYTQRAELLDPGLDGEARAGTTALRRTADGIVMARATDNQTSLLRPVFGVPAKDVAGVFHAEELDATFTCVSTGGTLYGAFSGFLGDGAMQLMLPVGEDLWRLPMPRALDHAPPGDWTLHFSRDAAGVVSGVEIGCWLARHVQFVRQPQ